MLRPGVSLHHQRSPEDLLQLLAWYKIRDTLLGQNCAQLDVRRAVEVAAVCKHPDAVWLTKVCYRRDVSTPKMARQVFLECESDPRALCFAAVLVWNYDEIRRAANLGDAYAQALMAGQDRESFRWAEKSAAQGERDGFRWLGFCYKECENDIEMANENYFIAAELGHFVGMSEYGRLFDKTDPRRFFWLGKSASGGLVVSFLQEMEEQVHKFKCGTANANVIFAIGRALKGHTNAETGSTFGEYDFFDEATQALQFYKFQLISYRKAVDNWTLAGIRKNVMKDIRILIAKIIWEMREEAKYVEGWH
jgi:hypothetical protein